ncbi:MAG: hypothetical protein KGN38_11505 [Actinomycetales bacterium]|nr:hypothetical protein [Actinomycetales bacterium]
MADDDIEIGESIEVSEIIDESGEVIGVVVDDVLVVTGEEGSVVEETVDVFDAEGNLVAEEDVVDVYDADGNLVAEAGEIIIQE